MAGVMERWEARAVSPDLTGSQRAYAARRARRLNEPYAEALANCARAGMKTRCGCKGSKVTWYTCRKFLLCKLCRKQRARRYGTKIWKSLECRLQENPDRRLLMVTLTVRPGSSLATDRKALIAGWREFYRCQQRRWGGFPYVATVELHRSGVCHLHVAALWPRGNPGDGSQGDWSLQRTLWLQSCSQSERIHFSPSKSVRQCARYVAKYVSKGVQDDEFTPLLRARVIAATYNTRWVLTSAKFWELFKPCCPTCGEAIVRARFKFPRGEPPSMAERLRLLGWSSRGGGSADTPPEQLAFELGGANQRPGAGCS